MNIWGVAGKLGHPTQPECQPHWQETLPQSGQWRVLGCLVPQSVGLLVLRKHQNCLVTDLPQFATVDWVVQLLSADLCVYATIHPPVSLLHMTGYPTLFLLHPSPSEFRLYNYWPKPTDLPQVINDELNDRAPVSLAAFWCATRWRMNIRGWGVYTEGSRQGAGSEQPL